MNYELSNDGTGIFVKGNTKVTRKWSLEVAGNVRRVVPELEDGEEIVRTMDWDIFIVRTVSQPPACEHLEGDMNWRKAWGM